MLLAFSWASPAIVGILLFAARLNSTGAKRMISVVTPISALAWAAALALQPHIPTLKLVAMALSSVTVTTLIFDVIKLVGALSGKLLEGKYISGANAPTRFVRITAILLVAAAFYFWQTRQ